MSAQDKKTLILVEDDPLDRMLTRRSLSQLDLPLGIVELSDGQQLLEYLDSASFDLATCALILLDLKMPRLNGLQTLAQIQQRGLTTKIPIVIMSSSSIDADISTSYALGARAFVTKPISHLEFQEAVNRLGQFWCRYNQLPARAA